MRDSRQDQEKLKEKVIAINRVAKVVKGGKRFSFNAIVVVGDSKGRVGHAMGKANDVSDAIRKGVDRARKELICIPLKNTTIPYAVTGHFGASRIIIKPAVLGTGIIAGGPARLILECAGITDILTKTLGSHDQPDPLQPKNHFFQHKTELHWKYQKACFRLLLFLYPYTKKFL